MRTVAAYIEKQNLLGTRTVRSFAEGVLRSGDRVKLRDFKNLDLTGIDAVALWGYHLPHQAVIHQATQRGIPWIFFDVGYWRQGDKYYKVSVNDRHPTSYFFKTAKRSTRWDRLKQTIQPWRPKGNTILVCGMSAKAAWSWNLDPQQWETNIIGRLRSSIITDHEIIYRPKPSWKQATPISGSRFDARGSINEAMDKAHIVIAHHSNAACDALVHGVPVYCERGIASMLSSNLEDILSPHYSCLRTQWAYNAAYCQWTLSEMKSGECYRYLLTEGLIK